MSANIAIVPFDLHKLHVPTETEDWPQGRAQRVSVNSFGVGGANAHVSRTYIEGLQPCASN